MQLQARICVPTASFPSTPGLRAKALAQPSMRIVSIPAGSKTATQRLLKNQHADLMMPPLTIYEALQVVFSRYTRDIR